MTPLSASLQLLLSLCLTFVGAIAFPTENNTGNLTESNATGIWDPKANSVTTITPTSENSRPSGPMVPEITRSRKTTQHRILYITDDYYYDEDDDDDNKNKITVAPPEVSLLPCPYNRCKHLEPPCEETQIRAGGNCLCPGLRGRSFKPDSPRLGQVIPGVRGVSVNWCSPLSVVQGYKVLYKTDDGPPESGPFLNSTYRFYSIENLLPDTTYKVCVVAFNEAGESPVEGGEADKAKWRHVSPGPCMEVHTSSTQESKIYLGIGVGLAALAGILGIIACSYSLWKKKKASSRKVTDSGERGITNMSFKADSVEQL